MPRARELEVVWTATAEGDLERVCRHIAWEDAGKALAAAERIEAAASRLATLPLRGRIVPELTRFGITEYRELVVAPWRIIYRVHEARVFVLGVIDGRRNVEDVLLERLVDPGGVSG